LVPSETVSKAGKKDSYKEKSQKQNVLVSGKEDRVVVVAREEVRNGVVISRESGTSFALGEVK
jgi:hypothetical protein